MVAAEALAGLAGVALFAAPGAGLAELLPAVRAFGTGHRLAYAWLLGVAWTAGLLYALSHFFAVPLRAPAILAVAALPAVAGAVSWLRRRRLPSRSSKTKPWEWLIVAVCAAVSLAVLCETLTNPVLDWDGWMTWAAQARYMRHEGTVDPSVLTQRGWYVSHPWYPLLLPVAMVAVLETTHADWDDPVFRPFYAAFFPVWLLVIYGGARALAGRAAAGWTTLAAALLPVPAFELAGGAVSAYSDLPLACFYGGGLALLLTPRLRPSAGLAAGILLAATALTKAEGAALAPAALVFGGVYSWRHWRQNRGPLAMAPLPLGLAFILLFSWRAGIPERFESYEKIVSWSFLWPGILTRAPRIAAAVRAQMGDFSAWGFFWWTAPLVLAAGAAGSRGLRRRATLPLLLAVAAPLGVAWISYTISLTPEFIVQTSWNRFLIQASVPGLLLLALALRNVLRSLRVLRASSRARDLPERRLSRLRSRRRRTPA
ncbi:MAG TPA: hypothetical protein VIJ61_13875 [Thermoanaerobaculia bacterium]